MESKLVTLQYAHRRKEVFEPLVEGRVGMYVCGPTVYGDPHLGHARPAVTFDLLFRYLALGYKVRYVRNITDVGHLEHDADEGEDKIAKKAGLEQLEPMEVATTTRSVTTGRWMRSTSRPLDRTLRLGTHHRADRLREADSRPTVMPTSRTVRSTST